MDIARLLDAIYLIVIGHERRRRCTFDLDDDSGACGVAYSSNGRV